MKSNLLMICFIFLSIGIYSCLNKKYSSPDNFTNDKKNIAGNRLAAEWEPALGVMFAWPPHLPHKLIIELAKDTKIFPLIEDTLAQQQALSWFKKWEVDTSGVEFIYLDQGVDASWVRDWGPHAIYNSNTQMKLGDAEYMYSTPISGINCESKLGFLFTDDKGNIQMTNTEDKAPESIANHLDLNLVKLPFTFTGGNVLTDGMGTVFSTCVIKNENKYDGMPEEEFIDSAKEMVGAYNYHFISNFEKMGIQHIDCFMKVLDEKRILVASPPKSHELHTVYERIVEDELIHMNNLVGENFEILKIDTDVYHNNELAAYTNSLILNHSIYVPLFGIDQDEIALEQWRKAMPGYTIKGFEFIIEEEPILAELVFKTYNRIGWTGGDALHCRTRAVWDPELLFLNLRTRETEHSITFISEVIDYSQRGLAHNPHLYWREATSEKWNILEMKYNKEVNAYVTSLSESRHKLIEYYISAFSLSGNSASKPIHAPIAFFTSEGQEH